MPDQSVGNSACPLSRSLLDTCPYAFTLDGQARISAIGSYHSSNSQSLIGRGFLDVFSIDNVDWQYAISALTSGQIPTLPNVNKRLELEIRDSEGVILIGSLLPVSTGGLLFLGTISPALIGELENLKLTLGDFAPFDVLPDFAMMAQINHSVLVDTQRLNQDLSTARDEAVQARQNIEIVALRDDLTGLANRAAFQRASEIISSDLEFATQAQVHMLLLDLNRFKPINDLYGHHVGDQILSQIGQKITETAGDVGQAFRIGGDEFAVIYQGMDFPEVQENAHALAESVNGTFVTDETRLEASASIGLASLPKDADDFTSLYKAADIALYSAKITADQPLVCVSRSLIQDALERDRLETELDVGLRTNEFLVAYQLQFDIDTGTIAGAEALARWHNPRRGEMISPAEFIPIAEKARLVPKIDLFVLAEAARQSDHWRSRGIVLPISINLSPVTLETPGLAKRIVAILEQYDLSPSAFEFEITEGVIIRECEEVESNFTEMHRLGLKFAIDDFGAGQTSLSHLATLPVSRLKLDRCLITGIEDCTRKQRVVRSLVSLALGLDLKVTVEGIETQKQADFIHSIGGVTAQGFLFALPQSARQLTPYLMAAMPTDHSSVSIEEASVHLEAG